MNQRHTVLRRPVICALQVIALLVAILVLGDDTGGATRATRKSPGGKHAAQFVPGEILVKFKAGIPEAARIPARRDQGASFLRSFHSGVEHWRLGPGADVTDVIKRLTASPLIEYAEPNFLFEAQALPDQPGYVLPLNYRQIDLEQAWNLSTGSREVVVGIIDSGIDDRHPDLAANLWTNPGEIPGNHEDDDHNGYVDDVHGYDFVHHDGDPFDRAQPYSGGHGTAVAGVIGAVGENGLGQAGISWRVSLMSLRIFDDGPAPIADIMEAIDYAAMMNVPITNNSYGDNIPFAQSYYDAIAGVTDSMLFVAAAGNDGKDNDKIPSYPSSFRLENIISVASTDYWDSLSWFSNFGATSVDLAAPGECLETLDLANSYAYCQSGTSLAAPHVAGVAALLLAREPGLSIPQLKSRLLDTVDQVPALAGRMVSGGRLNAFAALGGTFEDVQPGRIGDLAVVEMASTSAVLRWSAPGDNGAEGRTGYYDIRYSTAPIEESNFGGAHRAGDEPMPVPADTQQQMEIHGLDPRTHYYFAVKAIDDSGNTGPISNIASGTTRGAPVARLDPPSVTPEVGAGASSELTVVLSNSGEGPLDFEIPLPVVGSSFQVDPTGTPGTPMLEASRTVFPAPGRRGGPDGFGYQWIDSDTPGGPPFEWVEISTTEPPLQGDTVFLGFVFPFYAALFDDVHACRKGYLVFGDTCENSPGTGNFLPSKGAPFNMVAPLWGDLGDPDGSVQIFSRTGPDRAILEWIVLPGGYATDAFMFEVILEPSGDITFLYLSMVGEVGLATVGIQDGAGRNGLQAPLGESYLHNHLAIHFSALPQWLSASPQAGRIPAGGTLPITIHVDARHLSGGRYEGAVNILTNDPVDPLLEAPIALNVIPDSDKDGRVDPVDNCPAEFNPDQRDADTDGVGDTCDPCTDTDHDGFGDPDFPASVCQVDVCPGVVDPDQTDSDSDHIGDACDPCIRDGVNDVDHDGWCADVDNCHAIQNPGQEDRDGDGFGDLCDNCPAAANPDQADANGDDSGDACQPSLLLGAVRRAGEALVATVRMTDPQGDSLSGQVSILAREIVTVDLQDAYLAADCALGFPLGGIAGEGVGFTYAGAGQPYLFDIDAALGCHDARADYALAYGPCDAVAGSFETPLSLAGRTPPIEVCVRSIHSTEGGTTWTVLDLQQNSARVRFLSDGTLFTLPFEDRLPSRFDLSELQAGNICELSIRVTDENTLPVTATTEFEYQGERFLSFDAPPLASVSGAEVVECESPAGGLVRLDGSTSTDPDSSLGTHDDIASFEWFEDYGNPSRRLLGTTEALAVALPMGAHALALRVTDWAGENDVVAVTVVITDSHPPVVHCPVAPSVTECEGVSAAFVELNATAQDVCSSTVSLSNDRTSGGGDASGFYPLGTTRLTFTATDGSGNRAICTSDVTVRDSQAPILSVVAEPGILWPPNHEMVPVRIRWTVQDQCDPDVRLELVSVTSNEPDDAVGTVDGDTLEDIVEAQLGASDGQVSLRAERSGAGAGRTYELTYRAIDASDNTASALAVVTVPHDLGSGPEPLLMRLEPNGTPGMVRIYWTDVSGTLGYDVISGDLSQVRIEDHTLSLGTVNVLVRGTTESSLTEGATGLLPSRGRALFYLIQQRTEHGAAGYGTESAPWPRIPISCGGGCP